MKTLIRLLLLLTCFGFFTGQVAASSETIPNVVVFGKITEPEQWAHFETQVTSHLVAHETFPPQFLGDAVYALVSLKDNLKYLSLVRPSFREKDSYSALFVHLSNLNEQVTFAELREYSQSGRLTIPVDLPYLRSLSGKELEAVKQLFPTLVVNYVEPTASEPEIDKDTLGQEVSLDESYFIGDLLAQIEPLQQQVINLEAKAKRDTGLKKQLQSMNVKLADLMQRFEELKSNQEAGYEELRSNQEDASVRQDVLFQYQGVLRDGQNDLGARQGNLAKYLVALNGTVVSGLQSVEGLKAEVSSSWNANQNTRSMVFGVAVILILFLALIGWVIWKLKQRVGNTEDNVDDLYDSSENSPKIDMVNVSEEGLLAMKPEKAIDVIITHKSTSFKVVITRLSGNKIQVDNIAREVGQDYSTKQTFEINDRITATLRRMLSKAAREDRLLNKFLKAAA